MLSLPTLAYLASWRGQVVLTLVAVVVGGIYFALDSAYARFRRSRKHRLAEERAAELLAGEDRSAGDRRAAAERDEREVRERISARERGREKRKEFKEGRRKLVKETGFGGSAESSMSPAPTRLDQSRLARGDGLGGSAESSMSPAPTRLDQSRMARGDDAQPLEVVMVDTTHPSSDEQRAILSASTLATGPTGPLTDVAPHVPSTPPLLLDMPPLSTAAGLVPSPVSAARSVPLPPSPAGPSRATPTRSQTFSIYPEDGYLPPSATASVVKKKKRKAGKTPNLAATELGSPAPPTTDLEPEASVSGSTSDDVPPVPATPRHRRKVSAASGIPLSPALNTLLEGHEKTVDALRAEIGIAKAEESKAKDEGEKAREEVRRVRAAEEKMKGDWERARKARDRAEMEGRKREAELHTMQSRYAQLSQAYAGVVARLNGIEAHMRDQGPSASPALPSPMSSHPGPMLGIGGLHQPVPSPMHSPYLPFPMPTTPGYQYPSPGQGMFPPPMMHPYHPVSPFRRASASGQDVLAGPLTPGAYQSDLPAATPSSGVMSSLVNEIATLPGPSSGISAADLRRINIEASVLKKKSTDDDQRASRRGSTAGSAGSTGYPTIPEIVEGLGMGDISPPEHAPDAHGSQAGSEPGPSSPAGSVNGTELDKPRAYDSRARDLSPPSSASASGPRSSASSPSPPRRLVTPAEVAMFGAANGDRPIRCVPDPQGGNVYVSDDAEPEHADDVHRVDGMAEHADGLKAALDGAAGQAGPGEPAPEPDTHAEADSEEPVFASLAHGPEQLAEIRRMRERAQARGRREVVA